MGGIPRATISENLRFTLTYTLPGLLRGAFTTNPMWLRTLTRLDSHGKAMEVVERMRVRHGGRSIMARGPSGPMLLVLSQEDARTVLTASDEVFSLASPEKVRGLGIFQPDSLILSSGDLLADRHRFNDYVLAADEPFHPQMADFAAVIEEELARLPMSGELARDEFDRIFGRISRRVLFGDSARDDTQVSVLLKELRREANWLGLRKWRHARTEQLLERLNTRIAGYVAKREGLMSRFGGAPTTERTDPAGQVSHWLMAFDVLGLGIMQALALLASHPKQQSAAVQDQAYRKGALLEGLRLWAPVPNLMRITTAATDWHGARLPAGVNVLIPAAPLHRNPQIEYADRFAPEEWLDGEAEADWWINPFSRGPGSCPGASLGLQIGTATLHGMLRDREYELLAPALDPDKPLPYMLDAVGLRFAVRQRVTGKEKAPSQGSRSRSGRKASSDPAASAG